VRRVAETEEMVPSIHEPYFERSYRDFTKVQCGEHGQRLSFRCLFDSGATLPSLHTTDLYNPGIQPVQYGAQSVIRMVTANGEKVVRVFELFVCVLDEDGRQLVDKNDPVYPHAPYYLGSMCPVVEIEGEIQYDEQGREICLRLSGMSPFVACCVASAPTRDGIHLGKIGTMFSGAIRCRGRRNGTWKNQLLVMVFETIIMGGPKSFSIIDRE
jgi:hypothetical protein